MSQAVIGSLRVTLGLDSAQFQDGIASAQKGLQNFEAVAGKAVKAAAAAAAVAAAAIGTAFAVGVTQAVKRVEQMEASARRLDKALQNTGNAANTSSKEVGAWAEDLERRTGRAAQEVMDIGANLATFGFGEKTFTRAIELANDMAAAWGGDLKQNMEGLARALADPEKGLAMLSQRGITFTEEGKKMAVELAKNGELIKAQAVLMGELEAQVKGVAEEGYQGLAKSLGNLNMSYEGFFDTVAAGSRIQDVLSAGARALTGVFDGLKKQAELLAPALRRISDSLVQILTNQDNIDTFVNALVTGFQSIVNGAMHVSRIVQQLVEEFRAWGTFLASTKPLGEGWTELQTTLDGIVQRSEAAKASIKSFWDTAALSAGLGSDFGRGWTAGNDNEKPEQTAFGEGSPAGLTEKEQAKIEREREMLDAKIQRLRESLMTEQEIEDAVYQERLEKLAEFEEARGGMLADSAELRAKIEADYNDRVARLQEQRLNDFASTMGSAGSIIESLTKIMGKEGDKQFGIVKALSLAEALINVYTGITAAMRLPFPANMAAAAQVAAQGFATIASMKSVSKGGSSSGGGGGSAASAAAPAAAAAPAGPNAGQSMTVGFQGDYFTTQNTEKLAKDLLQYQRDGGSIIWKAA